MKKHARILAGLLFLLVGCAAPAAPPSAAEQILILWHPFTGAEREALQVISDAFNADNPWGIHLVAEYQEDIFAKVAAAAPDQRPDLIVVWPEEVAAYRQAGLAADLTPLPPGVSFDTDDLLPMARALFSENGELQGLPLGLSTYLVYYNADWLGDLGYNEQIASWEDLRRAACASTDPVGGQMGLGLTLQPGALLAQLAASGAPLADAGGNVALNNNDALNALVALHTLLASECGSRYATSEEGITWLANNAMAMIIDSSQHLSEIEQRLLAGRRFSLAVGPIPGADGPGPTLWYGPGLLLVSPAGARRQAAFQALAWFLTPDAQQTWSSLTQQLPVQRTQVVARLDESAANTTAENTFLALALQAADTGQWAVWPRHVNTSACRAALMQGLVYLGGDNAPRAILGTIQTQCSGEQP